MKNLAFPDPVPDLDKFIVPENFDLCMTEVPTEASTSLSISVPLQNLSPGAIGFEHNMRMLEIVAEANLGRPWRECQVWRGNCLSKLSVG